jgi:hypothetical protein
MSFPDHTEWRRSGIGLSEYVQISVKDIPEEILSSDKIGEKVEVSSWKAT